MFLFRDAMAFPPRIWPVLGSLELGKEMQTKIVCCFEQNEMTPARAVIWHSRNTVFVLYEHL